MRNTSRTIGLNQMGKVPALSRREMGMLVKWIGFTRKRFRRKVLECGGALRQLVGTLKRGRTGGLPSLDLLMQQNEQDFEQVLDPRTPDDEKLQLRRGLRARRRQAVTLVEELSIRTHEIRPLMEALRQTCVQMDELERRIKGLRGAQQDCADLEKKLHDLTVGVQEEPAGLRGRVGAMSKRFAEYEHAKRTLCGGNLRMVLSIAKNRRNRGLSLLDLIQEGTVGLMLAADRYEYRRGARFSTYAWYWIYQAITQAIAAQAHLARSPVLPAKPTAFSKRLVPGRGQRRSVAAMVRVLGLGRSPVSLEQPLPAEKSEESSLVDPVVGESEDSCVGDFIEDDAAGSPVQGATRGMLEDKIEQVLKTLTYREREIIKLRYGLGDGYTYTLEEVGRIFKVTREYIRQIEVGGLRKLRNSAPALRLKSFLDDMVPH